MSGRQRTGRTATAIAVLAAQTVLSAVAPVVAAAQEATRQPIPAEAPIQGPGWTVWVPALLFLVAAFGTWSLWRHFADKDD